MLGTEDALFNIMKIPTIFASLLKLAQKPQNKKCKKHMNGKHANIKKNAFASFKMTKVFLI